MKDSTTWTVATRALIGAACLASAAALAQSVAPAVSLGLAPKVAAAPVISLAPAPKETVALPVLGEASFANAPANFRAFSSASLGESTAPQELTLNFASATLLTSMETSKDFRVVPGGSCVLDTLYTAGTSCTVQVQFTPQGPGRRLGSLSISHTASASPMTVGLGGNGYAPVLSFTPALITTVPGTYPAGVGLLKTATNMAVGGGDIVYIADTGNNIIREFDSSGSLTSPANSPIATPVSLAVDNFGIIYTTNTTGSTYYFSIYYPWGSETAYGYAHTAGTCTPSAPCAFSAVGMSSPANMSIDAYNNLFFEEGTQGAAEMPVGGISGGSGSLNLWYLSDQFAYSSGTAGSFAADAFGNIYTHYTFSSTGTCYILEESLYNAEYSPTATRVAGGVKCGFSGDGGQGRAADISTSVGQIAFDIAGNLYFSDTGNQRVRRIDAVTGIITTIAGTGTAGYTGDGGPATLAELSGPTGVAVDSQGQVYIISSATTGQIIRKLGATGKLPNGGQLSGTTSAAHTVEVSNTGNSTLVITKAFINGTNPGDFGIDPATTSCNLNAGGTLIAGQSCKVGILFKPAATGARSANLVLLDNTVTNSNTVVLTGTGLAAAALTITSPQAAASVVSGSAVTFAVRVTSSSLTAPTGTVRFAMDGVMIGGPVALSSGLASVRVPTAATGTHTLAASYGGDAHYAATGPVKRTFTVTGAASSPISAQ